MDLEQGLQLESRSIPGDRSERQRTSTTVSAHGLYPSCSLDRSRSRSVRPDSPHQLPATKDDHQVRDDAYDDLLRGAHRGLARYPMCELIARLQ